MTLAFRRRADVMFTSVDGEVLALDVARGQCYGMNEVASRVWELLEQPRTIEDLCDKLVPDYDIAAGQCASEIATLIEQFQADGLVEPHPVN